MAWSSVTDLNPVTRRTKAHPRKASRRRTKNKTGTLLANVVQKLTQPTTIQNYKSDSGLEGVDRSLTDLPQGGWIGLKLTNSLTEAHVKSIFGGVAAVRPLITLAPH